MLGIIVRAQAGNVHRDLHRIKGDAVIPPGLPQSGHVVVIPIFQPFPEFAGISFGNIGHAFPVALAEPLAAVIHQRDIADDAGGQLLILRKVGDHLPGHGHRLLDPTVRGNRTRAELASVRKNQILAGRQAVEGGRRPRSIPDKQIGIRISVEHVLQLSFD